VAVAVPARRRAAAPAPSLPRRRPAAQRRRLRGGIAWIVLLAVLLTGVVALNVAVLRLNMSLDNVDKQRTDLQAQIAALESEVASAEAAPRIQSQATHLGLVPAPSEETSYVTLTPRR
jgi:cell division protein FtsL